MALKFAQRWFTKEHSWINSTKERSRTEQKAKSVMHGSCKRGLGWSRGAFLSWGGPSEVPCMEARGPGLCNLSIYQSHADSSKTGDKSWVRQVPPSEVRQFLGRDPLWASSSQHSQQLGKWVCGDRSNRAWGHSLPTGVKTHCQQVILWPHQQVPLFLHCNLGSCISHNVGKSPESFINTEAFIWALHFLQSISFSHFRSFYQMDILA